MSKYKVTITVEEVKETSILKALQEYRLGIMCKDLSVKFDEELLRKCLD